jgi:hypothetical protein
VSTSLALRAQPWVKSGLQAVSFLETRAGAGTRLVAQAQDATEGISAMAAWEHAQVYLRENFQESYAGDWYLQFSHAQDVSFWSLCAGIEVDGKGSKPAAGYAYTWFQWRKTAGGRLSYMELFTILGDQGWELVQELHGSAAPINNWFWFKRPRT